MKNIKRKRGIYFSHPVTVSLKVLGRFSPYLCNEPGFPVNFFNTIFWDHVFWTLDLWCLLFSFSYEANAWFECLNHVCTYSFLQQSYSPVLFPIINLLHCIGHWWTVQQAQRAEAPNVKRSVCFLRNSPKEDQIVYQLRCCDQKSKWRNWTQWNRNCIVDI